MEKSVKKNYLYNLSYKILTLIIPLITVPYLARIFEVEGIGINAYTLSIVSYFILFGEIGIASYGQREVAINRNNKEKYSIIFLELFILRIITNLISIICFVFLIFNVSKYNIILSILTINIFASMLDISWLYQGLEEYKYISIRNICIKLIFTILIFIFINKKEDLLLYILLNSLSLIISSLSLWIRVPKLIHRVSFQKLNIKRHIKNTLIYFLPQVAIQIYTVLDKTMLGIITGSQIENGYYEQAHKIITMSLTVIISLNTVMEPRMSFLYKEKNLKEFRFRLLKSMKFSILLAIPMAVGIAMISNNFVKWFFGEGYDQVINLLIAFSPIILIISLSNCLGGQYLVPSGLRLKSAYVLCGGAIINFILNLMLIPNFKSMGAVISSVLSELIITGLYIILSKEYINFKELIKYGLKCIFAAAMMGIIIYLLDIILPFGIVTTFVEIVVGTIVYIIVMLLVFKEAILTEVTKLIKKQCFIKSNRKNIF